MLDDVIDGFVGVDAAQKFYGVVIDAKTMTVDQRGASGMRMNLDSPRGRPSSSTVSTSSTLPRKSWSGWSGTFRGSITQFRGDLGHLPSKVEPTNCRRLLPVKLPKLIPS